MGSTPLLNNHCWWAMPNNSKPNFQSVLGMIHYWLYHIILNHHGMIAVIAIHNVISVCSYGMILCQVCLCSPYLLHSYESWVVVKGCTIQYWLIVIGNDHNQRGIPIFLTILQKRMTLMMKSWRSSWGWNQWNPRCFQESPRLHERRWKILTGRKSCWCSRKKLCGQEIQIRKQDVENLLHNKCRLLNSRTSIKVDSNWNGLHIGCLGYLTWSSYTR